MGWMVEFESGRSEGMAEKHWPSMLLTTAEIVDTLHRICTELHMSSIAAC